MQANFLNMRKIQCTDNVSLDAILTAFVGLRWIIGSIREFNYANCHIRSHYLDTKVSMEDQCMLVYVSSIFLIDHLLHLWSL